MIRKLTDKIRLLTSHRKESYLLLPISKILGFQPKNIELYELALVHKSILSKSKEGKRQNNERLEFLGDAVLDAITADVLFQKFDDKKEGFLTNTRSKIVQRETLNKVAISIGLDKLMVLPPHNHTHNLNIYGNAFEAIIGAIYLDYGYEQCKWFMTNVIFAKHLNLNKLAIKEVNFKSKLIEWSQRNKVSVLFDLIEERVDAENNPIFQTQILINGNPAGVGVGYTKKESQQNAAQKALRNINANKRLYLEFGKNESQVQESDELNEIDS
ncbi:MAG: ribonuclease III [Paludibacteraceae bacterium]|nr:ribonuclease III [Paludibacteraceae bacterium]